LSSYPHDAKTVEALMTGVDVAMYRAKALGKDGVCLIETIEESISIRATAIKLKSCVTRYKKSHCAVLPINC